MGRPIELQSNWSRGMKQDFPRVTMPAASSWNMVDLIPDLGAPLRKRGGWAYASPNIAASAVTGATYIKAVSYVPFAAAAKLCCITDNNFLVTVASTASATNVGAVFDTVQNPVLHDNLLIIPAADGTTKPKYYDGTTLGNLGGTPPAGKYAVVYNDRTVLGASSAEPQRAYFSLAANPAGTWDTTNSWVDFGQPITGFASLGGALLVFQQTQTSRIRGNTPPPGGDFIRDDPIFNVGCTDARSIATYGPYAVFANPLGVYRTNATSFPEELTKLSGLSLYWQDLMASYSSSWTIAGHIYKNYYFVSVMDGSTFKDAFAFDLSPGKYVAYRLSNLKSLCFDNAVTIGEELYFGLRSAAYLGKASTMFAPSQTVKNDGDGTAVTCTWETPMYGGSAFTKTWRSVYLTYDMRDEATDNPSLQVSYIKNPEDSYTAVSAANNGIVYETSNVVRGKVNIKVPSDIIALKVVQSNASANTRFYGVEADVHVREGSRIV